VDETLLANGLFRATCAAGAVAPSVVPGINRLATRLTGDREYSDLSAAVFTQHRGVRFREMEYAVPVEHLAAAFDELRALVAERGWRISFPVEVRVAAADGLWLSTATGRATGYIAVHRYWREDPTEYFAAVEEIMLRHGGRPHWGKMHTLDAAQLRGRYPRFDDFRALRDRLDPSRMFRNPYLDRVLDG
jgi:FAD/FMN-containing dehydrogenase